MSDSTYDALFDLRGELEKNISSAIAGDLSTYTRLEAVQFQKDRARFELLVKIGAPLGHRKILSLTDRRFDMFNFTLSTTVVTAAAGALKKNADESDADFAARKQLQNGFHTSLVAHLDAYLSQLQLSSKDDTATFPKLTLLALRGTGHQPNLKPQEGSETTTLNHAGQFGIRPEAWLV